MTETVRIHEEVGVARTAEIVVAGIPIAGSRPVLVVGPDGPLPTQELWRSGGWVSVAFPVTIDALGTAELAMSHGVQPPSSKVSARVVDERTIRIDNDHLRLRVCAAPFAIEVSSVGSITAELTTLDGRSQPAVADRLEIVYDGPLLARIRASGRYGAAWAFSAVITVAAGSRHIDVDLTLMNDDEAAEAAIAGWTASVSTAPVSGAVCGAFEAGHHSTAPFTLRHRGVGHARGIFATAEVLGGDAWTDASEPGYGDRWEWAELNGRLGQNWVVLETIEDAATAAVSVAVHRFGDNHPTDLATRPTGAAVGLWPADAGELRLTQGAAKTRRLRIAAGADRRTGLRVDHPLVATACSPASPSTLPYLPERYPNLEAHIREELFGWYQSGQSLGFHDLGDSMQGIVSGPRTGYSANNEHDALYALCLHYLRSGERAYYDSAAAYADHLVDIDQIHHSTRNDFERGGLRAHGRAHVNYVSARTPAGEVWTSIDTGHLWTQGLVLFAQISGERRYLDAAIQVADCILRLHELGWARPQPGPRNSGWPLIALTAVAAATGADRFRDAAVVIARHAASTQDPDGRWTMRLGLHDDYCAWQNAVLLTGLAELLALTDDAVVRSAFLAGAVALRDRGRNPDGTFIYLERFDYRWANRTGLIREALTAAYDATQDESYLAVGLAGGDRWYRPRQTTPALSNDIAEWRGHLPFLGRAHAAGLLTDLRD